MKLVRVTDNKPCYQLEKKIQDKFLSPMRVQIMNLKPEVSRDKVFYFNKIFTLEKNLDRIKKEGAELYIDLDILFNKHYLDFLKDVTRNYIIVGNIYYLNWRLANVLHLSKYLPKKYLPTIKDLVDTNKRYSTMMMQISHFEEFLKFLNKINYKEIVKDHYNKYLEEFLFSVFTHHKRLKFKKKREKELVYNLFLRKDDLVARDVNAGYIHLTTKEILPYYKFFLNKCGVCNKLYTNKDYKELKKLVKQLDKTEKYN